MTQEDMQYVEKMLNNILATHTAEINGRFNVIHVNLLQIKEQTTKTNGTVMDLSKEQQRLREEQELHPLKCPQIKRIIDLENNELSRRAVMKFIILIGGASGTIAGLIIAGIQIILNGIL